MTLCDHRVPYIADTGPERSIMAKFKVATFGPSLDGNGDGERATHMFIVKR